MSRFGSLLILVTYLSGCLSPAIPLIEYVLRYDQIQESCENKNQPQMQCHGKCYLSKKIAKNVAVTEKKERSSQPVITTPVFLSPHDFVPAGNEARNSNAMPLHFVVLLKKSRFFEPPVPPPKISLLI